MKVAIFTNSRTLITILAFPKLYLIYLLRYEGIEICIYSHSRSPSMWGQYRAFVYFVRCCCCFQQQALDYTPFVISKSTSKVWVEVWYDVCMIMYNVLASIVRNYYNHLCNFDFREWEGNKAVEDHSCGYEDWMNCVWKVVHSFPTARVIFIIELACVN